MNARACRLFRNTATASASCPSGPVATAGMRRTVYLYAEHSEPSVLCTVPCKQQDKMHRGTYRNALETSTSGDHDSRRSFHARRRVHNSLYAMFIMAVGTYTWIVWLKDMNTSRKTMEDDVFALNILWWIMFSVDAVSAFGDLVLALLEQIIGIDRTHATKVGGHNTTNMANFARLGVSMTLAVGLFIRWHEYFGMKETDRIAAFSSLRLSTESLFVLGSMGAVLGFGTLMYNILTASAELIEHIK